MRCGHETSSTLNGFPSRLRFKRGPNSFRALKITGHTRLVISSNTVSSGAKVEGDLLPDEWATCSGAEHLFLTYMKCQMTIEIRTHAFPCQLSLKLLKAARLSVGCWR